MKRELVLWVIAILCLPAIAGPAMASGLEPAYASATVDGSTEEWDAGSDLFGQMHEGGDPAKPVLGNVYLRYDCDTGMPGSGTLYVLVLASDPVTSPLMAAGHEAGAWASVASIGSAVYTGNSGNDGAPPDFHWVGLTANGMHAEGYEASFQLQNPDNYYIIVYADMFSTEPLSANMGEPVNLFCTVCAPTGDEICDGIDNDCDGVVDDFTQEIGCGVGACFATGTHTCTNGVWGDTTCTAGEPGAETCNNIDDDCDGTTDESLVRDSACGLGACASTGTETCSGGIWGDNTCIAGKPVTETCNAIDDDCDGAVDDGLTQATTCGLGACASTGELTCTGGSWEDSCNEGSPTPEICDTLDNDCDGSLNEDGICGSGCSATAGYWLHHASVLDPIVTGGDGNCGYVFDVGDITVNTPLQARVVLEKGACPLCEKTSGKKMTTFENPLNQLYRQTLSAELAVNNCIEGRAANPAVLGTTLTDAETFLAAKTCLNGCELSAEEKAAVSGWNAKLGEFNAGTLPGGPSECGNFAGVNAPVPAGDNTKICISLS